MHKESRREHILRESAILFKERGFAGATMRDIADRVGIEAGSMYNHIQSKQEVLEDICFRMADQYYKELDTITQDLSSPSEKIEALIRHHVQLMISNGPSVFVANNEWKAMSGEKLRAYKRQRSEYENRCRQIIEDGIATKEFRNVHPAVALYTLLSSIQWIEQWYREERDIHPAQLEDDLVCLVLGGLRYG